VELVSDICIIWLPIIGYTPKDQCKNQAKPKREWKENPAAERESRKLEAFQIPNVRTPKKDT
jgi:hypothetical protein